MKPFVRTAISVAGLSIALVGCFADDTDNAQLSPPEVIKVGGVDGGNRAATEEAAMEAPLAAADSAESLGAPAGMADDMAIMPGYWTVVTDFTVGESLGALPTNSTGYVYRTSTSVSEAVAVRLAETFGVDPTPQSRPPEYQTEWAFGPEDGTAPQLTIDAYSQHYWWYSPAWATTETAGRDYPCTESIDENGEVTVDCPEPEPPVNVPTAAEAEQMAREYIRSAGFDPDALTYTVSADEWYASVYAIRSLLTDVEVSAENWSFGFGAEGRVDWAGGSFTAPEAVGPYPLIDLDTAIERLKGWYLQGAPMGAVDTAMTGEEAASSDMTVAVAPMPADDSATEDVMVDESWVDPMQEEQTGPTEITVSLVDVVADLWWATDVDGNTWLVPAYRFIGDDGGWYTVPAVTDEYLIETPVVAYDEPTAVEAEPPADSAGSGSTGAGSSGSFGDGANVAEDLARALDASGIDLDPELVKVVEELLAAGLLTEDEFADAAASFGATMRVVERDGEMLAVTEDYSASRVNVVVADGYVIGIDSLG